MEAFVYMLRCADGADYVGSHRGSDVANRVADHNAGLHRQAWTHRRRPVELVWSEQFAEITDAKTCLLCYEADPAGCHRAVLAEPLPARAGWRQGTSDFWPKCAP